MTWFDHIKDLQYYHQPKGVPCYCEAIAYRYYVTVIDACNNGLPVQVDWCRTHEYEER